jgi:hypothetical protein
MTMPDPNDPLLAHIYRDRSHLVALAALHYPSYIAYSDPDQPAWPVVTVEMPTGQASWHIHPADLDLFPHVASRPADEASAAYDGHTTDEKHARIRARIGQYPESPAKLRP